MSYDLALVTGDLFDAAGTVPDRKTVDVMHACQQLPAQQACIAAWHAGTSDACNELKKGHSQLVQHTLTQVTATASLTGTSAVPQPLHTLPIHMPFVLNVMPWLRSPQRCFSMWPWTERMPWGHLALGCAHGSFHSVSCNAAQS